MALVRAGAFLWVVLATARLSFAACGDDPGDAAAVTAAQAAIDGSCACDTATSHGAWVACVRSTLDIQHALRADCRGSITRCRSRSTCGRPGSVTCCRTRSTGDTSCGVRRNAERCRAPIGGSACVGARTSCCDACVAGGCAPPPPTTTTTTLPGCAANPTPTCGGPCPAGMICYLDAFTPGGCKCYPDGSQPCGSSEAPLCNGTCGTGERCGLLGLFGSCACLPEGVTPCGETQSCGLGACPSGQDCFPYQIPALPVLCACGSPSVPCCQGGVACPSGQTCTQAPGICMCF